MADDRCDVLCLDLEKAEDLRLQRLDPTPASSQPRMPGRGELRWTAHRRPLRCPPRWAVL